MARVSAGVLARVPFRAVPMAVRTALDNDGIGHVHLSGLSTGGPGERDARQGPSWYTKYTCHPGFSTKTGATPDPSGSRCPPGPDLRPS